VIWIALVIAMLAEGSGLIEKLGGPQATQLTLMADLQIYTVWQTLLWFATALVLFGIEALAKIIFPAWRASLRRWEVHILWPTRPLASRNLVFWVAILPLAYLASKAAADQLPSYAMVLVIWIALLAVTSLIEVETRKALLTYSRGNANVETSAPIRLVLGMLFGAAAWINTKWFANKKDLGAQTVARHLLEDKLLAFVPRLTLFCIGTLVTLLQLQEDPAALTIAIRLVLIAALAVGFFQSGAQLTLLALLGLFTADQFLRPPPSDGVAGLSPDEYKLALDLTLIILAWTLHHWEQAVRYRSALRAEQQKHKQTQTMLSPWGTAA